MKDQGSGGVTPSPAEGDKKPINSELWHACAGPLVSLPPVGSLVVYFPQGHSEQVAASMHKELDTIPSYPSLPSKLICKLLSLTLHADSETDEVYAQMTLQPVNKVGWDESTASERRTRVSIWEIEPVATPFYICPPPFFRPKLPKQPGMPDDENEVESAFKRAMPWLADDFALKDVQNALFPGLSLVQWMAMQQNPQMLTAAAPAVQSQYLASNALGKGICNLPTGQRDHRDVENELSSAAFSSQSFGVPDMSFKPGCSSDVAVADGGMTGQGQLEDPYRTDWKLVYVDHENDILLVGDDPWEEFVSCVKSIKILSSVEVQQMSLDGDLGCIPPQAQACSASDDANAWRG
nr:unnamed protein product [Digitaria exilis]